MGTAGTVGYSTGLFAVALLLTACSGNSAQQDAAVIATVDGHELTTADLANEKPTRAAVDSLIDEQLMAQQALADGLDSDPAVTHALENARRRILAEAFASRVDRPQSPPSSAQIEDYYRHNPDLFGARRLYNLAIFTVDSAPLNNELLTAIGHTASMQALSQLLAEHSVGFGLQQIERLADELPMNLLPKYSAASVGDVLIEADASGPTRLIQITGIDLRPITLESARPAIQRYLVQRDKTAALDAYLAGARARAQITYHVQEPAPARTKQTPALPRGHSTIAQVRSYVY